jgi:23S rRNA-/tRNA-specific pseudouridylate synthase
MAAIGHPIVGDKIYGFGGDALPNGGLTEEEVNELAPNRPSEDTLKNIAVQGKRTCVHAKSMSFYHPGTYEEVTFECDAPF